MNDNEIKYVGATDDLNNDLFYKENNTPIYNFEWEPSYNDETFWSANEEVLVPENFNDDY